jgi:hypothetical protein
VPSIAQICNYALAEVAQQRITSIDDATETARLCKLHLPQTIQEVLRSGKWKCAREEAELAELSDAPLFGWEHAFQLPTDFIRIVSLNDIDPDDVEEPLFEIRGTALYTDEESASLVYVKDLYSANVGLMDPLLCKAVYLDLAAKLAWPLQQSRTLKEVLEAKAEQALRVARNVDSRDERAPLVNRVRQSSWVPSRSNSTNG